MKDLDKNMNIGILRGKNVLEKAPIFQKKSELITNNYFNFNRIKEFCTKKIENQIL